jgi:hypothetical protein
MANAMSICGLRGAALGAQVGRQRRRSSSVIDPKAICTSSTPSSCTRRR